ncbi:MAG: 3-dehydrosphinganine reductase [Bogoriella megaspora]|nr:MAG: 3-dehydrosphinganine reductase [Bogoriella megaspora]
MFGFLSGKNKFPVDGRTILITGGSQGMGKEVAKILARKGANVVIVARDPKKLESALEYISSAASKPESQRFHFISADVTKPEENQRILDETTAWNHGNAPDIVWAVAGGSIPALFLETSIETMRSQMDLNYWSAAYLSHAILKTWLQPTSSTAASKASPGPRKLIMTSSLLAFAGLAGYSPYCPSKAALRNLADALRSELLLYRGARQRDASQGPPVDVDIHLVVPGTILSPGLESENKTKHAVTLELEKTDPKQTEEQVAEASIKALERGHFLITTHWLGSLMRAAALGGSPRNNWLADTVTSWVAAIAWLFVGPDLDGTVFKYGKKYGIANNKE